MEKVDEAILSAGGEWQEPMVKADHDRVKSMMALAIRSDKLYVLDAILTAVKGSEDQDVVYANAINELLTNKEMLSAYIDNHDFTPGYDVVEQKLNIIKNLSVGEMVETLLSLSQVDNAFLTKSDVGELLIGLSNDEGNEDFSRVLNLILSNDLTPMELSRFSRQYLSSISKYKGGDPLQSHHYDQHQAFFESVKDKLGDTLYFANDKKVPLVSMLLSALILSSKNNKGSPTNLSDFIKMLIDNHGLDLYAGRPSGYDLVIKGSPSILGVVENYAFNKETDKVMADADEIDPDQASESASQFLL